LNLGLRFRIWLSQSFRGSFPQLYSTLDRPEEVPVQVAAYQLAVEQYLRPGDTVLDVGFGLGYGMRMMASRIALKAVAGIDIDKKAVRKASKEWADRVFEFKHYDGYSIPYTPCSFDVVTCIDVIEHVPDYARLLTNMCKVARRAVVISTPNRRPEYTKPGGSPMNPWHIREWSYWEFDAILQQTGLQYEWNFLDGPWAGPFSVSGVPSQATMALTPVLLPTTG
jgi:ubiquinone/menaquinone biosynthesis C-methylase UbiE